MSSIVPGPTSKPKGEGAPIWFWGLLIVILVAGVAMAFAMRPSGGTRDLPPAVADTASAQPWDDVEPDQVSVPDSGDDELDRPLVPDTAGGE